MRNWIRFAAAHRPVIIRSVGIALTYGNIRLSPTYSHQLSPGHKRVGDLETQLSDRRISNLKFFSGVDDPERIQAEIDRLKTRLIELFGPPDEEDTTA